MVPAVSTQASTPPVTPRRVYTFPAAHERAYGDPSLPTRVNTFPTVDTRGHANSTVTTRDNTLLPIACTLLPFLPSQTVTSQPDNFPSWSLPFVDSTHVYTRPIGSMRVSTSSSTDVIPVTPTRFPLAFLHSKTDLPCLQGHLTLRTPLLQEVFIVLSPW